jgi:hypothetical protein
MIVNTVVCILLVLLVSMPLILPLPLAGIPVISIVSVRVHIYVDPATFPERRIFVIAAPEQMVWDAGVATAFGVGLTNTDTVMGAPSQLFAVGVTVKFTVCGLLVLLVKMPVIVPVPDDPIPVTLTILSLVHS